VCVHGGGGGIGGGKMALMGELCPSDEAAGMFEVDV